MVVEDLFDITMVEEPNGLVNTVHLNVSEIFQTAKGRGC